jgi:hypothetical protein
MSGLLQKFEVSSDTLEQLEAAISIVLPWHRNGASCFRVGKTDAGFSWVEFSYHNHLVPPKEGFSPLPYRLDTLPKLFSFVRDWLSSAERGQRFDTDGSCAEGWEVTQPDMHDVWEPAWLRIQTTWIIYGK